MVIVEVVIATFDHFGFDHNWFVFEIMMRYYLKYLFDIDVAFVVLLHKEMNHLNLMVFLLMKWMIDHSMMQHQVIMFIVIQMNWHLMLYYQTWLILLLN